MQGDDFETDKNPNDDSSRFYLSLIFGSILLLVLSFVTVGICLLYRKKQKKSNSNYTPKHSIPSQICIHSVSSSPVFTKASYIQPNSLPTSSECSSSSSTPSSLTPPLRSKKGLLERRCNNNSLKLTLSDSPTHTACEKNASISCSEQYLLSAGNRMTRKEFRTFVKNKEMMYNEFWEIPPNYPDVISVHGAGLKNRYKSILPNEYTRVHLPKLGEDDLSTYINANYIRGYGGEARAFIATQGPMENTVDDFWLMVWNENSSIIVMITQLKEKNRVKCEPYIPEKSQAFAGIEVEVTNIFKYENYELRLITLTSHSETRVVSHYWYSDWPDHKSPKTAQKLLDLAMHVGRENEIQMSSGCHGPIIIHCSAGIGRTGCFIAISIGIKQLREEFMVDVLGNVCAMRLDRGGMVQTVEQYEFVCQCLYLYEVSFMPSINY